MNIESSETERNQQLMLQNEAATDASSTSRQSPLLDLPEDELDVIFEFCSLISIAKTARCCRRLARVISVADRLFWKTHLASALSVPSSERRNVALADSKSAKDLLKRVERSAVSSGTSGVTNDENNSIENRWEQYRGHEDEDDERNISVLPTEWGVDQLHYSVDEDSQRYDPGHDFAARCRGHPVPKPRAAPFTVIRKSRSGSKKLTAGLSEVFYFEVHLRRVERERRNAPEEEPPCVSVGLSTRTFRLSGRQPGWTENSVGFHSDDGRVFFADGTSGTNFGPSFSEDGDVVGCGVHVPSGSLFFTKNGSLIGTALILLSDPPTFDRLYPTMGFDSKLFFVEVNFGMSRSFEFDVFNAEQLYSSFPPPTRQSRRLQDRSRSDAETSTDGTADVGFASRDLLRNLNLACVYREAATFHPWTENATTRRIYIQEDNTDLGRLLGRVDARFRDVFEDVFRVAGIDMDVLDEDALMQNFDDSGDEEGGGYQSWDDSTYNGSENEHSIDNADNNDDRMDIDEHMGSDTNSNEEEA